MFSGKLLLMTSKLIFLCNFSRVPLQTRKACRISWCNRKKNVVYTPQKQPHPVGSPASDRSTCPLFEQGHPLLSCLHFLVLYLLHPCCSSLSVSVSLQNYARGWPCCLWIKDDSLLTPTVVRVIFDISHTLYTRLLPHTIKNAIL